MKKRTTSKFLEYMCCLDNMKNGYKVSIIGVIPIVFVTGIFGLNVGSSLEINDGVSQNQITATESERNEIILEKDIVSHDVNLSCTGNEQCLTGMITRIVDGDTIYLDEDHEIRLSLTNTPERHEMGFYNASQFTAVLCPVGTKATVDQDDKQPYDVYGRMLGKVTCGNKVLNSELLYAGHANILTRYCSTSEFSNEIWAEEFGC
ncbi:thermonuclease family protein [Nitrosopumilus ureiphilus]|uniref:thermonuclease family protein n=1 Tax=Nitrosopumilus ureiphilus TaxID=1470067 RepID=UPI001FEAD693|nr:thermonuclease family protein [Nitrosopumilus ureiphilus]